MTLRGLMVPTADPGTEADPMTARLPSPKSPASWASGRVATHRNHPGPVYDRGHAGAGSRPYGGSTGGRNRVTRGFCSKAG
jgi:hypothetical protein